MPLNTSIERDGEPLQLRWSDFHVAAMICAAAWDSGKGPFKSNNNAEPPMSRAKDKDGNEVELAHWITMADSFQLAMYPVIGTTPLNEGAYTLTRSFTFGDCSDGEILELQPGDKLMMYRSMK